jgi:hypothetical protein
MASKKSPGKEIGTIQFNLKTIKLFEGGFVSVGTLGKVGNKVSGFLKGLDAASKVKDKDEQIRMFQEAKNKLSGSGESIIEKLVSIEIDTQNVTKKTGIGRGIAAIATAGISLAATESNRGDIYLTIVTENNSYSLHQTFPNNNEINKFKKFVALAKSMI